MQSFNVRHTITECLAVEGRRGVPGAAVESRSRVKGGIKKRHSTNRGRPSARRSTARSHAEKDVGFPSCLLFLAPTLARALRPTACSTQVP